MKKIWLVGISMVLALALAGGLFACGESSSGGSGSGGSDNSRPSGGGDDGSGSGQLPSSEWTVIYEFTGTFSGDNTSAASDPFELPDGEVRITLDQVATSNSGNSLIYILPEGWTRTQDAEGNLKIAVSDMLTLGTKTGVKQTITRDAGSYYIDINTASIESYKITIEVKNK